MRRIPSRAWWITGGVLILALLALMYRPGYQRRRAMEAKLEAAERERVQLEAEYERLTDRADALKHDPLALEEEARHQLGLVRPGEVIYKFPTDEVP